MSAQLAVRGISVEYDADGVLLPALQGVTFTVAPGEFVALVGASGGGKSTLIRVIAGLQRATRGQVLIDNEPVNEPTRRIALMFQEANLMPWRTVIDNIALPLELTGVARDQRREAARSLLPALGLSGFEAAYPGELSGGMAQRVALGRVLIQRPEVLLLDEPFGALDALTREQVGDDLMRMWAAERQTALMVTHDIHEAVLLSDRVLVMSRRPGRIIADIPVSLPRPRARALIYDEAFGHLAREVRAAIERG